VPAHRDSRFPSVQIGPVVHNRPMNIPADLGDPGREFWESIANVYDFTGEPANQRLLLEAARVVDRLDQLDAVVRRNGAVLSSGRPNPALVESRQQQLVLGRLVNALDLPRNESTDGGAVSDAAREIASARWTKHGRRLA
jgi:hypothetical protein